MAAQGCRRRSRRWPHDARDREAGPRAAPRGSGVGIPAGARRFRVMLHSVLVTSWPSCLILCLLATGLAARRRGGQFSPRALPLPRDRGRAGPRWGGGSASSGDQRGRAAPSSPVHVGDAPSPRERGGRASGRDRGEGGVWRDLCDLRLPQASLFSRRSTNLLRVTVMN